MTFSPTQAQEVATAFARHRVDYMFIGKSGAILLGYPGTTQDVHVFPRKDVENVRRIVSALIELGFTLDATVEQEIIRGKDFVQIKNGPFDINLVFAADGIESYDEAKTRIDLSSGFSCEPTRHYRKQARRQTATRRRGTSITPGVSRSLRETKRLDPVKSLYE